MEKIKVAVLFGGISGEHEISLISAKSVAKNLDTRQFDISLIGIERNYSWYLQDLKQLQDSSKGFVIDQKRKVLLSHKGVFLDAETGKQVLKVDVVFPVLHGPFGEDGKIQGMLEMLNTPYVGCGVLSSAIAMDKDITKRLVEYAGYPIVPFLLLRKDNWDKNQIEALDGVTNRFQYPVFVKPCNMGSSVGIRKAKSKDELHLAIEYAFQFDHKVLVEASIDAREIEISVLENAQGELVVSTPGEIIPHHEFYSYDAKYIDDNGAGFEIPAVLSDEQKNRIQELAKNIFRALQCSGLARVDFFLDRNTNQFYLNEINTLPGFTAISMYPKLLEVTGVAYPKLLEELIFQGIERFNQQQKLSNAKV